MDRLREEVEKAKQLQSQKEMLEQKLEVKAYYINPISIYKQLLCILSGTGLMRCCIKKHYYLSSHLTAPLCQPTF